MRGGNSTGAAGDGVYRYRTSAGLRWRLVFRRADGRLSSRRGYSTRAAAATARRELIEMLRADVRTTEPSQFDAFFAQIVKEKRAYLTVGALEDLESHGRIRLIPFFANSELATIDERGRRIVQRPSCREHVGSLGDPASDRTGTRLRRSRDSFSAKRAQDGCRRVGVRDDPSAGDGGVRSRLLASLPGRLKGSRCAARADH